MSSLQDKMTHTTEQRAIAPPLALGRADAADALGISVRKLDELVADRSSGIPFAKIGARVLFPVAELRAWLAEQVQRKGGNRHER